MNQALRNLIVVVGSIFAAVQFAFASDVLDGGPSSSPKPEVQSAQSAVSCEALLTTKYSFLESIFLKEAPTTPFVRVHHRPSATQNSDGIRVAMFPKGTYRPEYESELRKQGFFAAIQLNADETDAAKYPDFMFGPQQVYWMQPAYLDQEFDRSTLDPKKQKDVLKWFDEADPETRSWIMAAAPKSKDRSTLNKRLEVVGEKYTFQFAPLTLGDYERWNREIFQPEVARKKGGMAAWPATGKQLLEQHHVTVEDDKVPEAEQVVKNRYRVFAFDRDGKMAAGSIMTRMDVVNALKQKEFRYTIGAAVYNQESRRDGMATAILAQWLKVARQMGREALAAGEADRIFFSYGTDPNFYGPDVETTLQEFKLTMGFKPTPRLGADGVSVPKYLVKVLDEGLVHLDDRTVEEKLDPQSRPPEFVFYAYRPDGTLERKVIRPIR